MLAYLLIQCVLFTLIPVHGLQQQQTKSTYFISKKELVAVASCGANHCLLYSKAFVPRRSFYLSGKCLNLLAIVAIDTPATAVTFVLFPFPPVLVYGTPSYQYRAPLIGYS